ncbi:HNRNPAB [Cordylochernes scorpioides]|uniref:HNRNPAB n=1 Tax=Cordylochernes scorpioides TaxID=51811 RepID=A0ABY6LE24_9ARAC|nr:HNRNPAB [Cordylochernes scorpioides]
MDLLLCYQPPLLKVTGLKVLLMFSEDLKEYFAKYGEVTEVNIKTDAVTGKCRGFGFITFANKEAVDNVLNNVPHTIKGKQIDPKRAKARPGLKKIFVGGLDTSLSEADIRGHFEKYGKIEQIEQPFDKVRNQKRQFCFITFESEEVVEEACKQAKQKVGSKECDVKKATIKSEGRGGRSYGRGGSRGRGARNASKLFFTFVGFCGAYGGNANWSSSMYGQAGYGYGQGYGYSGYSSYDYPGYSSGYGSGYGSGFDYSAGWGYGSGQGYGTGYSK